jgi:hypothetical protein
MASWAQYYVVQEKVISPKRSIEQPLFLVPGTVSFDYATEIQVTWVRGSMVLVSLGYIRVKAHKN